MNKGELIGELSAKTTSVAVKEFTPQGVRIEQDQQGMISGKYTAQHIETAHILLSQDGSGAADGLAMEFTPEGDFILVRGRARGTPIGGGKFRIEAEVTYQTASQRLAWLNNTKARAEGTGDFSGINVKFYAATYIQSRPPLSFRTIFAALLILGYLLL
jgi:hypothetical protein